MRVFQDTDDSSHELKPDNFPKEEIQHKWVESNLSLLFPNLELIKRKMQIASKIPDTIAYDHDANTFVAIEYKNKRSDTVREQAESYRINMDKYRSDLAMTYNEHFSVRKKKSWFTWEKMYVVIIAPEFNSQQIEVADSKDTECLYELKRFKNGLVTLRFVGGDHKPIDTVKESKEDARKSKSSNNGSKTHVRVYGSKNPFYAVVRDSIQAAFPRMREYPTKWYANFGRDKKRHLCTVRANDNTITVYYGRKKNLAKDDFIQHSRWRGWNYRSGVKNEADLERLLSILKKADTYS